MDTWTLKLVQDLNRSWQDAAKDWRDETAAVFRQRYLDPAVDALERYGWAEEAVLAALEDAEREITGEA